MLHSLEDDGSIGRNSPEPYSVKALNKPLQEYNTPNATAPKSNSKKTSPRTASSPSSSSMYSNRDVNGMKKSSIVDDFMPSIDMSKGDEEVALLMKK